VQGFKVFWKNGLALEAWLRAKLQLQEPDLLTGLKQITNNALKKTWMG